MVENRVGIITKVDRVRGRVDMKNVNRIYYLVFFVIAFALQLLCRSSVSEAAEQSISISDMVMEYDHQRLVIKESAKTYGGDVANRDKEIFFAIGTVKKVKPKGSPSVEVMTTSSWDSYDYDVQKGVVIDLSTLNRAKDNYVLVRGDISTQDTVILIPKVISRVSAKYDVEHNQIYYYDMTNQKSPRMIQGYNENGQYCSEEILEYRTAYSGWNTYGADTQNLDDLSLYLEKGATLFFRIGAGTDETVLKANANISEPTVSTILMGSAKGEPVKYFKVNSFPGIEVKVTIPRRTNAPKVTIDYGKQQFNLLKGAEYRIVTDSHVNAWIAGNVDVATKLQLSELLTKYSESAGVLEVRLAKTTTRLASKIMRIALSEPDDIIIISNQEGIAGNDIENDDIFHNSVKCDNLDMGVTVGYVYSRATKVMTGIRFFNDTTNTYEVYISKDGQKPSADSTPVYTVLAKKTTSVKEAETTISTRYVSNGDKIYIRKKADASKGKWSSRFVGFGTIQYDPDKYAKWD